AHRAARADRPGDADAAAHRGIARLGGLVASPERSHARVDHARDLVGAQPLSRLGGAATGHLTLPAAGAGAVFATAAAGAPVAGAPDPAAAGAVAASLARAEPRLERAGAKWNPLAVATATRAGAFEAEPRSLAEHDAIGAQPAERVRDGADGLERAAHLLTHVPGERLGHSAERGTGVARLLRLFCGRPAAERALRSWGGFLSALFFLVLRARIFDALVAAVARERLELLQIEVVGLRELLVAGQLERLGDAERRGDRPDQPEPAADRDEREQERQQEPEIRTAPPRQLRGLGGELEKEAEVFVLQQAVIAGDDRDGGAALGELHGIFAPPPQQQHTAGDAARVELPARSDRADRHLGDGGAVGPRQQRSLLIADQ